MLKNFQQICHDLLYADQQKSHFLIFATCGPFCKDATHISYSIQIDVQYDVELRHIFPIMLNAYLKNYDIFIQMSCHHGL